ncbi:hypothetical protein B0H19DRAFT_1070105 [Mycena capillaripes]|nr:hypothetical protein B0H19DRAFT_1070105 [Mycena capillaripes]
MKLANSQSRMCGPEPTSADPGVIISHLRDTPERDPRQAARPQSPITWHIDGAILATFDVFIISIPSAWITCPDSGSAEGILGQPQQQWVTNMFAGKLVDLSQIPNASFTFFSQTFTDGFSIAGTTLMPLEFQKPGHPAGDRMRRQHPTPLYDGLMWGVEGGLSRGATATDKGR